MSCLSFGRLPKMVDCFDQSINEDERGLRPHFRLDQKFEVQSSFVLKRNLKIVSPRSQGKILFDFA
jgi:hypothetical protein